VAPAKAPRKLASLRSAKKGGIAMPELNQSSPDHTFPIQMTEGEYRRVISEMEKYRRLAARVPAPIYVQRDRYNEIIGWTDAIVRSEIEERDRRIQELEQRIAAHESSDSPVVISHPAAARAA
jgi:hypothetical protein